jgi:hypothetical protein
MADSPITEKHWRKKGYADCAAGKPRNPPAFEVVFRRAYHDGFDAAMRDLKMD